MSNKTLEWNGIIGRVIQPGTGAAFFVTPHGTIIKMGMVWLGMGSGLSPLKGDRRKQAADLILDARQKLGRAFPFDAAKVLA